LNVDTYLQVIKERVMPSRAILADIVEFGLNPTKPHKVDKFTGRLTTKALVDEVKLVEEVKVEVEVPAVVEEVVTEAVVEEKEKETEVAVPQSPVIRRNKRK
jgi:hypothetical protein